MWSLLLCKFNFYSSFVGLYFVERCGVFHCVSSILLSIFCWSVFCWTMWSLLLCKFNFTINFCWSVFCWTMWSLSLSQFNFAIHLLLVCILLNDMESFTASVQFYYKFFAGLYFVGRCEVFHCVSSIVIHLFCWREIFSYYTLQV